MARTDAEIHQILRTIMPGPGFQADLMDKAIKWIMTAVGTVVVIAGLGIVFALGNQGYTAMVAFAVLAVLAYFLARPLGKILKKYSDKPVVDKFRSRFEEGSEDFERAVQILNMAKGDDGPEKQLLEALGMDIQFVGAPPPQPWTISSNAKYTKIFTHPSSSIPDTGSLPDGGLLGDFHAPPSPAPGDDLSVTDPLPVGGEQEQRPAADPFIPLDPYARPVPDRDAES